MIAMSSLNIIILTLTNHYGKLLEVYLADDIIYIYIIYMALVWTHNFTNTT